MNYAYYTTVPIMIPAGTMVGTTRVCLDKDNGVDFAVVDIGRWDDVVESGKIAQLSAAA